MIEDSKMNQLALGMKMEKGRHASLPLQIASRISPAFWNCWYQLGLTSYMIC